MRAPIRNLLTRPMRLPRLTPYVPEPDDPAIFWFNSERDDIIREVVRRIAERYGKDRATLEYTLNDVCLLYTSPSPRDGLLSRMPSSA